MLVETAFAEAPVERFHERILGWLARLDEVQPHSVILGPKEHRFTSQFGAVIADNRVRQWSVELAQEMSHAGT